MIRVLVLAAAFLLAPLSVAAAQVSVQTDTPIAGEAATGALAELQAAGGALEPVMDALEAEAAVIRADSQLSAADKEARILALIAPHEAAFDRFGDALAAFIEIQVRNDGGTAEQAAAASAEMRAGMLQGITQSLVTGERDKDGD